MVFLGAWEKVVTKQKVKNWQKMIFSPSNFVIFLTPPPILVLP